MKFLVTNDDGLDCIFLHELVHALRDAGHSLAVVAPKKEQSWMGASKSRNRPVHAERVDGRAGSPDSATPTLARKSAGSGDPALQQKYHLGCPTWSVDGTPSDCVNIALDHLLPADFKPDAVLSGINIGLNVSLGFIIASGTLGGAWEGALHGLPAIAYSQDLSSEIYERIKASGDRPDAELHAILKISAQHAARLTPQFVAATPPQSWIVHNVNFPHPCHPDSELRRTVPARVLVPKLFSPAAADGTHNLIWNIGDDLSPPELITDRGALAAGFISHTILDYKKLGQ